MKFRLLVLLIELMDFITRGETLRAINSIATDRIMINALHNMCVSVYFEWLMVASQQFDKDVER